MRERQPRGMQGLARQAQRLGRVLLQAGLINQEQLDVALAEPSGRSLCAVLVEQGGVISVPFFRIPFSTTGGAVTFNAERRIVRFVEKPKDPAIINGLAISPALEGRLQTRSAERRCLASMGIYVFDMDVLRAACARYGAVFQYGTQQRSSTPLSFASISRRRFSSAYSICMVTLKLLPVGTSGT